MLSILFRITFTKVDAVNDKIWCVFFFDGSYHVRMESEFTNDFRTHIRVLNE